MFGTLYIVATPIGNLSDISFRALDILRTSDVILAEDTRVTKKLLSYYEILNHTLSYHSHTSENKKFEILKMLLEGKTIALITDAGTPGISDPGNELIDFILEKEPDIQIIPIPGASSVVSALSVSGFRSDKFTFLGFLPKKKQTKTFKMIAESDITVCFFESPRRLIKTLEALKEHIGDRRVFVARELTKMHEEHYRGTVNEVLEKLKASDPRGEVVVVVEGK